MLTLLIMSCGVTGARGQVSAPSSQGADRSTFSPDAGRDQPHDESRARLEEQLSKSRNSERQRRLIDDTNKLLSLATELKTDVDKTDKNTLSVDVIKKADEIEKLARSVKDRMKS